MSDIIHEECGLALVRLKKPLSYYQEKYGTSLWGFHKLFLLMEKQHNRGQDGAGIGTVKLGMPAGAPYIFRMRQNKTNPLDRIFNKLLNRYSDLIESGRIQPEFAASVKKHFEFGGEIYIGHLRYGTSGGYNISSCHPYFRKSNWPTRNLMLAGNFNITNTPQLNIELIKRGQHPVFNTDTQTLLEEIGFHLDEAHEFLYQKLKKQGMKGTDISVQISQELRPSTVLQKASAKWDGGYGLVGIVGNGDCFGFRDPNGIRPLYYFENDEVISFASERAPLMTGFNIKKEDVYDVKPGSVVVVKADGTLSVNTIMEKRKLSLCSFERIYFSRGNDPVIYQQRRALGGALVDQIFKAVDQNKKNTVISFIPNTAEIAYYGLFQEMQRRMATTIKDEVLEASKNGNISESFLDNLLKENQFRVEKVAHKDIKLRTFISQEQGRAKLASHVYDISYDSVTDKDYLVCIDDSIVRGTTLKESIIKILATLNPKKIVIASTAPQIRYPDCYGIDMSELHKFIAFQAAVSLLKDHGREGLLEDVYEECRSQLSKPSNQMSNCVKQIYDCFTPEEISHKISQLVSPKISYWHGEVEIIYQTIENLHKSLGENYGDWYFTGNYPTPGGYRVLNKAYINYYENREGRSY
ncbi:MAG: amidophosphoribosyltransferase [Fibrobacteria bacterium]|nr:amidophosphoribosyltransferase [Fibrobacteria bacterium]